jgi:hypothetical protein
MLTLTDVESDPRISPQEIHTAIRRAWRTHQQLRALGRDTSGVMAYIDRLLEEL